MNERKELQRARMLRYFLDAASEVIEEEGLAHMTIRKVADRAGYTASTAYNYFKDLSHLKFFASMRFTSEYISELPDYMALGENTVEKWLYSWECFCKHSFEQPDIYSVIFMDNLGTSTQQLFDDYYAIHENDLIGFPEQIQSILMEHDFSKRSALYIQSAVEGGFIKQENVDILADMTLMIWKGMMNTYMNHRRSYTKDEAIKRTLHLVTECVMNVVEPSRRKEIKFDRY
ncbi:TetR/AcrR family transcriptional regulator [Metabacillus arenae]|uniref:TetR/AcrR family transcriptional regulator n=1 Tax=Metabacillus arenae TaxID=2771434 RepID=A0A926RWQ2_9BACI|nr:TetR/AcrR family transcriptional regulator [Metabacillus arenae]MBD1379382.1 TetR/AcrR family transcriptional regulator [Metabacillus arenae]